MVNLEGLKYYFQSIEGQIPQSIVRDVFLLVEDYEKLAKVEPKKTPNRSGVVQVDAETGKEIARFATKKAANIAIGKPEKSSGISDAANGRTATHKAYGFKWYHADEWDEMNK